jgi:hypothetical protein
MIPILEAATAWQLPLLGSWQPLSCPLFDPMPAYFIGRFTLRTGVP